MLDFALKCLGGTSTEREQFSDWLLNGLPEGPIDFSWGVPPVVKCSPDEAEGMLFEAYHPGGRWKRGTIGTVEVPWWEISSRGARYGRYLGMFKKGGYADAVANLNKHLGVETRTLPVKRYNPNT